MSPIPEAPIGTVPAAGKAELLLSNFTITFEPEKFIHLNAAAPDAAGAAATETADLWGMPAGQRHALARRWYLQSAGDWRGLGAERKALPARKTTTAPND